jgi:uncharacterized protein YgfB (UPF0149 family)
MPDTRISLEFPAKDCLLETMYPVQGPQHADSCKEFVKGFLLGFGPKGNKYRRRGEEVMVVHG